MNMNMNGPTKVCYVNEVKETQSPYSNQNPSITQPPTIDENVYSKCNDTIEYQNENCILKHLNKLMKTSFKIPEVLLDEQKNLIITKSMLQQFISIMLKTNESNVLIYTADPDVKCCCVADPILSVEDIKIKCEEKYYRSLIIHYNEIYNRIITEFSISLSKIVNN
jgi:hypothetical protein